MKSFDYLVMKRPTLVISQHLANICSGYEAHLTHKYGKLSDDWAYLAPTASSDEHLAHNTHTNGMLGF